MTASKLYESSNHNHQNNSEDQEGTMHCSRNDKTNQKTKSESNQKDNGRKDNFISDNADGMVKLGHDQISIFLHIAAGAVVWTFIPLYGFCFLLSVSAVLAGELLRPFFPWLSSLAKPFAFVAPYHFTVLFLVAAAFLIASRPLLIIVSCVSGLQFYVALMRLPAGNPPRTFRECAHGVVTFIMPVRRFRLSSFPVSILCIAPLVFVLPYKGDFVALFYLIVWIVYVSAVVLALFLGPESCRAAEAGSGVSKDASLCLVLVRAALAAAAWGLSAVPSLGAALGLTAGAAQAAAFVLALLCVLTCALTDMVLSRRAL